MTPCNSSPTVDIEIDVSNSCNCCLPFRKKKKVKNVEQKVELEKTDSKVEEIAVKKVFTSHDSSKSDSVV